MTDADSVAAAAPTEPSPDPSDIPPTEELLQFLSPESRADVRGLAVEAVLGITASDSAVDFFTENPAVIDALMPNTGEGVADTLKEVTYSALVNLSTMPQFATRLVDNNVRAWSRLDTDPELQEVHDLMRLCRCKQTRAPDGLASSVLGLCRSSRCVWRQSRAKIFTAQI